MCSKKNIEVTTSPLVTVLLAVYNGGEALINAIESVTSQSYPNWELIVVDDCSMDSSLETAKNFSNQDKRINIIALKEMLGLPKP